MSFGSICRTAHYWPSRFSLLAARRWKFKSIYKDFLFHGFSNQIFNRIIINTTNIWISLGLFVRVYDWIWSQTFFIYLHFVLPNMFYDIAARLVAAKEAQRNAFKTIFFPGYSCREFPMAHTMLINAPNHFRPGPEVKGLFCIWHFSQKNNSLLHLILKLKFTAFIWHQFHVLNPNIRRAMARETLAFCFQSEC